MRIERKHFLGAFELAMVAGMLWFAYSCWQAFGYRRQLHPEFTKTIMEAETLRMEYTSQTMQRFDQDTSNFKAGTWSQNKQVFFPHGTLGDQITIEVPPPAKAGMVLRANFTTANDYGRFDLFVEDKFLFQVDLYTRFISNREVPIMVVDKVDGPTKLTFKISGHHPDAAAPHYHFGIDGFWYEEGGSDKLVGF